VKARHVDVALCAGRDLTIELRDGKALVTLLRRTIPVKIKKTELATPVHCCRENQAKWPIFC
jgi:hypothetical protein